MDKTYFIKNVNGGGIGGQIGQSYSQWVNFEDVDSSRAILPVGNSENTNDPHFNDQADIWLNLQMRSSPLKNSHFKQSDLNKSNSFNTELQKLYSILINVKVFDHLLQRFRNYFQTNILWC